MNSVVRVAIKQAADDRSAQRRVLLAAFAQSQSHWDHSQNHR